MKKLFIATLLILLTLCAIAEAEKEIYPFHKLDMETYGNGTSTVHAKISFDQITEYGCMTNDVYDLDLYNTEEILALKAGDMICVYNHMMIVENVVCNDGEILINGGIFCEEGKQGATLWMLEDAPTVCVAVINDDFSMTMIGQANYMLANPVTVTSFHWGEDGNWNGEYDAVEVAPAVLADYMSKLEAQYIFADVGSTTLTLKDGMIIEIRIDWRP